MFLASNSKNKVAAVKIVERNPNTATSVDREVETLRELTALAENWDDSERTVRLLEVIGHPESHDPSSLAPTPFQEVALVMVPMTPLTLSNLVGNSNHESAFPWFLATTIDRLELTISARAEEPGA